MYEWLQKDDCAKVALFDATNTTKSRRTMLVSRGKMEKNTMLVFIESICDDPEILAQVCVFVCVCIFLFFYFCRTLNLSPSAGRVCGLKGSTYLSPGTRLAFWSRGVSTPAPRQLTTNSVD